MDKKRLTRILLMVLGVLILGVGIGFLLIANLGADPYSTLALGITLQTGISFGTSLLLCNLVLLVIVVLAARRFIGVGTFFNLIMVGYFADFTVLIFADLLGGINGLLGRIILTLVALLFMGFGAALYMTTELGTSPYDAVPAIIEKKSNKRLSYRVVRIIIDIACVIAGYLLGATVGLGTILAAFLVGPLMQFFSGHVATWMAKRKLLPHHNL